MLVLVVVLEDDVVEDEDELEDEDVVIVLPICSYPLIFSTPPIRLNEAFIARSTWSLVDMNVVVFRCTAPLIFESSCNFSSLDVGMAFYTTSIAPLLHWNLVLFVLRIVLTILCVL